MNTPEATPMSADYEAMTDPQYFAYMRQFQAHLDDDDYDRWLKSRHPGRSAYPKATHVHD